MAIVSASVIGAIAGSLAKLLVSKTSHSEMLAAVASELAKGAGSHYAEKIIPLLVTAYVQPLETHPEFRDVPEGDREAIRIEVEVSLRPALDRDFLGPPPYEPRRIVNELYRLRGHRGTPVGFVAASAALYQQLLEAAVRSVIAVAENSPKWPAANATAIHLKLDRLADDLCAATNSQLQVLDVLDVVGQSIDGLRSAQLSERRLFLERYYRAIRTTLDRMELYGLDAEEDDLSRAQRLSVAYISLNLTSKEEQAAAGSRSWESVLDTLQAGDRGRLLVRGDAGMGKTTLLRWAAIAVAAQRDRERPPLDGVIPQSAEHKPVAKVDRGDGGGQPQTPVHETWRGKVPLLVILRECQDGKIPDIDQFPAFVNRQIGPPPPGLIRWILEQGKGLVMIDGLDEVPPGDAMKQVTRAITEQLEVDGERPNFFVVTSRPLVQDPAWIKSFKFREAVISPMTDGERDLLIRRWHDAIAAQTDDQVHIQEVLSRPADLITQINERPPIARLASVPLLCAMICAQSLRPGSQLPQSEFEIINRLSRAMLYRRDEEAGIPKGLSPWDELDPNRRVVLAQRLALYFIEERRTLCDRATVLGRIAATLGGFSGDEPVCDDKAEATLNRMYARGGVLKRNDSGAIEFAHNTFKEFLAAPCFVKDNQTHFLDLHAEEDDCANICRYVAGVDIPAYTERLMREVISHADHPPARDVVAVRMRTASPDPTPAIHVLAKEAEERLLPLRSHAAAKAVADLGEEIVSKLAYEPNMPVEKQILNAAAMSQMRSKAASTALRAYAPRAVNLTLIELLSRAINPLSIPLVQRACTEPDFSRRPAITRSIRSMITDAAIREWLGADPNVSAYTTLDFRDTNVSDAGARELARPDVGLKSLKSLCLWNTKVTDAGVKDLTRTDTGLNALRSLNLRGAKVTDAGVMDLARPNTGLNAITELNLNETEVTDAGAEELARADSGLNGLTKLEIWSTQVTGAGVSALLKRFPGLSVTYW